MLQLVSAHRLDQIELVLRHAAHRHGGSVLAVSHLGQLLRDKGLKSTEDAIVFTICHADLYAALLAADVRFAAFLPCRIAACRRDGEVIVETMLPVEFCRLLGRPDLEPLADRLEAALRGMMEEAAGPVQVHEAQTGARRWALGATEEQINARASIPQRIDCRGTKVEELAGTGQHDSSGG